MEKMTVSVPEELLVKLKKSYPEINWAAVVRAAIIKKLEQLEKLRKQEKL